MNAVPRRALLLAAPRRRAREDSRARVCHSPRLARLLVRSRARRRRDAAARLRADADPRQERLAGDGPSPEPRLVPVGGARAAQLTNTVAWRVGRGLAGAGVVGRARLL